MQKSLPGFWSKKVKKWSKKTITFGILPYLKGSFEINR